MTSLPELAIAAPPEDLCLAFANTRYWRGTDAPTEELHRFEDVIAWCGSQGGISPELLGLARDRLSRNPRRAEGWFAAAIALREMLVRIFKAVAEGKAPQDEDLTIFDAALASAPSRSRITRKDARYVWQIARPEPGIGLLLAPVLWSAADLLTGKRLDRARRCGNDRCLWLFLDDSKSGNRRWCSMSQCGNRAKAHRHRAKRKGS